MSGKKGPQIQEEVSPNLIPMIDIMFLLLLFFMLSADMSQRELADVTLPMAKSVKEDKPKPGEVQKDRLTVNVYHKYESPTFKCPLAAAGKVCRNADHWLYGIRGDNFKEPGMLTDVLKKQAELDPDPSDKTISNRRVMIRADKCAPYGYVQKAMNVCAKVGIFKVEVGAAQVPDEKKHGGGEH